MYPMLNIIVLLNLNSGYILVFEKHQAKSLYIYSVCVNE